MDIFSRECWGFSKRFRKLVIESQLDTKLGCEKTQRTLDSPVG